MAGGVGARRDHPGDEQLRLVPEVVPHQRGVHVRATRDRPDARPVEPALGELVARGREDGATGVLAGRPTTAPTPQARGGVVGAGGHGPSVRSPGSRLRVCAALGRHLGERGRSAGGGPAALAGDDGRRDRGHHRGGDGCGRAASWRTVAARPPETSAVCRERRTKERMADSSTRDGRMRAGSRISATTQLTPGSRGPPGRGRTGVRGTDCHGRSPCGVWAAGRRSGRHRRRHRAAPIDALPDGGRPTPSAPGRFGGRWGARPGATSVGAWTATSASGRRSRIPVPRMAVVGARAGPRCPVGSAVDGTAPLVPGSGARPGDDPSSGTSTSVTGRSPAATGSSASTTGTSTSVTGRSPLVTGSSAPTTGTSASVTGRSTGSAHRPRAPARPRPA